MKDVDPGIFGLIVLPLLFINLLSLVAVTVYARDKIDKLLSRCSVIVDNKETLGGLGIMGDIIRVGVAGGLLTFPKVFRNKTIVDEEQVNTFPSRLKAMIVIQWIALALLMLALVILSIWMKSSSP
ncbi:hypothetical protein [Pseudomonas sp. W5-36]|jgi:hypothetical protein|uniref:hypothetical protein n=1 Tax=Pseudomonas sp. W5-36 TaxID=3097455 RepID=UPI003977EF3E